RHGDASPGQRQYQHVRPVGVAIQLRGQALTRFGSISKKHGPTLLSAGDCGTTFKLPHNSGAYAYCPPLDSRWKGLWDLCSVAGPHGEWVKRLGLVDITEAVIASGKYSRYIIPVLLKIGVIDHADGAVPPRLEELIHSTHIREQEKLVVRSDLVKD